MYQQLYAQSAGESAKPARERERKLLEIGIRKLAIARMKGPRSPESFEATRHLRDVWGAFVQDLSDEENALPRNLRGSLISIGLWVGREADLIDAGASKNYDGLIEVNQMIADGLN